MVEELQLLLQKLHYYNISFISHDETKRLYYFDALIDTYYRVICEVKPEGTVEIYDTTFDEDNYVWIATAQKDHNQWHYSYK